jgi:hypothetical protein
VLTYGLLLKELVTKLILISGSAQEQCENKQKTDKARGRSPSWTDLKVATCVNLSPRTICINTWKNTTFVNLSLHFYKKICWSFIFLKYTHRQCMLSYGNSTAMHKFLKTLHLRGIRTCDLSLHTIWIGTWKRYTKKCFRAYEVTNRSMAVNQVLRSLFDFRNAEFKVEHKNAEIRRKFVENSSKIRRKFVENSSKIRRKIRRKRQIFYFRFIALTLPPKT